MAQEIRELVRRIDRGLLLAVALGSVTACASGVETGTVEILETFPHDSTAYTQGLLFHDGFLYESTGKYGSSELRRVDPRTGEVVEAVPLDEEFFGEGLARVEDRLVQLTWKEGAAFVYDLATLERERTVDVDTHGWGLCYDGESLYLTSGGSILFRRDPETLEAVGSVQITMDGSPISEVNELECVGEHIYANVFQSTLVVKIDKGTGEVVERFEAAGLVPGPLRGDVEAVLNGIAYDPGSESFYLTGKLWPATFRVRFVSP